MSRNSLQKAKEAKKNPVLLGSTNASTSIQPKTYSKVERASVQAGKTKHKDIKGYTKSLKTKVKKGLAKVSKKKDNK